MWTTIGPTDIDRLWTWVQVMQQMDPGYGGLDVLAVQRSIAENRAQVLLYDGANFQIAVRFGYDWDRSNWQIANLGFVGNTTPAAVLDLFIPLLKTFLTDVGANAAFGVRPKAIAYAPLMELYVLAERDPRLRITVQYETELAYVWQVQVVGA